VKVNVNGKVNGNINEVIHIGIKEQFMFPSISPSRSHSLSLFFIFPFISLSPSPSLSLFLIFAR